MARKPARSRGGKRGEEEGLGCDRGHIEPVEMRSADRASSRAFCHLDDRRDLRFGKVLMVFVGAVALLYVASPHATHRLMLHCGLFTAIRFGMEGLRLVGSIVEWISAVLFRIDGELFYIAVFKGTYESFGNYR